MCKREALKVGRRLRALIRSLSVGLKAKLKLRKKTPKGKFFFFKRNVHIS